MNKKIQTLIFTSALLLFLSSPSIAVIDDYQGAVDAYSREDYKTAYELMLPLAEKGFAKAQYNLGLMYGKGKGVNRDYKEAVRWYLRAAEKGYSKAQTNLGWMYEKGKGVPRDDQKAAKWYQLASDQGVAKAQEKLILLSQKNIKSKSQDDPKGLIDHSLNINAKSVQGGVGAFNKKDYKAAYKFMLPLAEQGVAKAQYNLGLMYGRGKGIVKDDSKAVKWWKLAADQGDGKSQTNLGWMYEKGRGVNQDDQEAIKWYRLASDQGFAKAQEKLNLLLNKTKENLQENTASSSDSPSEIVADNIPLKGDAFAGARYSEETLTRAPDYINDSDRFHAAINSLDKKEFATAHRLFFDLADKGVAEAQINLGMMFEDGQGVSQDFNEAIRWYRLAADQGLTKAQEKLNFLLKSKSQENLQSNSIDSKSNSVNVTSDEIRDDLSVSDRFHAALSAFNKTEFDTAYQLFFELADKGIAEAQINIGMMFENGQGVPQDYGKAVRWYRHAADQGLIKAQYNLGLMYAYGKGVDKDPIEAIKWYRLAVDQGLIQAQTALGLMYKKGDGVTQDFKEAAKLYQLAAEQGDPDAQYQLGLMYSNGEGISKDYREAAKWFQLAVEQGNMLAQGELDGLPAKKSLWEKVKGIF